MNRSILFLFGSLILLLNCSRAFGQGCATTLSPRFSVYNSISRDGKNIYTSVTIQGYANVSRGPGCNMSVATHHVGAENKLNNVDHWTYSGNGCPTCYFSATDNEQIVGVPGVNYPWNWEGVAICSIAGTFFGNGGSSNIEGCLVPVSETTAVKGPDSTTTTQFNQTIGDSNPNDKFDGMMVREGDISNPPSLTDVDTCWYYGSGILNFRDTGVTGTAWFVAGGEVVGQSNHWGFDAVGYSKDAVDKYRANDPGRGIPIPCGYTLYQKMQIQCSPGVWLTYTPSVGNKLTATIDHTTVMNCRYDMDNYACDTINY